MIELSSQQLRQLQLVELELLRRCNEAGDDVITTGFNEAARIHPVNVDYVSTHTDVELSIDGAQVAFSYPLVGRFNVSNVMLAFGIGLALGIDIETIVAALKTAPQVPGRLQRIDISPDEAAGSAATTLPAVFVDYAHTPDALEKAIASVKALTTGCTLVVFGCGGDRDASKRPIMGRASLSADYAIVTSDNPRHEDPLAIIDAIVAGMKDGEDSFEVEPDRRAAIAKAIALAQVGDSILVAGKGHEDYQIIGDETHHFSDAEVVAEELERAL